VAIPLIILAAIAIYALRYAIGFTCGRITRELGPFDGRQVAVILTVIVCVCVFYYSLGQFVASIPS
jgi:hypothetical protein